MAVRTESTTDFEGPWFGVEGVRTGPSPKRSGVPIDPHRFRRVLGHLPTGVTVITANGPSGPLGFAANSVTSVSLEPPLMLFCPAKSSSTWPKIRASRGFCINVLASSHEGLCRQFAGREVERFSGVDYQHGRSGPILDDAIAWMECRVRAQHDAGDHIIVVADVLELNAADGIDLDPMVFFRGSYGSYRSTSALPGQHTTQGRPNPAPHGRHRGLA